MLRMCELLPEPYPEWQMEHDTVMQDRYVRQKCSRIRRLKEKRAYIDEHCPQIKDGTPGIVLDIGPGPGEFLELCRSHGHEIHGIETAQPYLGMGGAYSRYSWLMCQRQQIPVSYHGLLPYLVRHNGFPFTDLLLINAQGSLGLAFSQFLSGPPHSTHHDSKRQSWCMSEVLISTLRRFVQSANRALAPGGRLLVFDNEYGNQRMFARVFRELGHECMDVVRSERQLWEFERTSEIPV